MPNPSTNLASPESSGQLPSWVVKVVWAISLAPIGLMLLGVEFGATSKGFDFHSLDEMQAGAATDAIFSGLRGAFLHVLLEWSAVVCAFLACVLCFANWTVKRSSTLPIIGVALVCAGGLDAFHTLAATRLIEASAPNSELVPFTWVIARVFDIAITTIGVVLCLRSVQPGWGAQKKIVLFSSIGFLIISYVLIHICATSPSLPKTQFPDALITRPWDAIPLIGWLLAAGFVFLPFHRKERTCFSHALLLAVIPQVATEVHMAFGSSRLFDAHFNVAHFLKIVGYGVPVGGLLVEYVWTLREQRSNIEVMKRSEELLQAERDALTTANGALELRNEELDDFAHVASHDLQEPLRKLLAFSDLLAEDIGDDISEDALNDLAYITDAASRMSLLVKDILALSRSGRVTAELAAVDIERLAHDTVGDFEVVLQESGGVIHIEGLPSVITDGRSIRQLLHNLISNGLKYAGETSPVMTLSAIEQNDFFIITVADNGIGIPAEYRESVFAPFKRLHGRAEYQGSGIGLAICKKSVSRLGGEIWIEENPGGGTQFRFSLPCAPATVSV